MKVEFRNVLRTRVFFCKCPFGADCHIFYCFNYYYYLHAFQKYPFETGFHIFVPFYKIKLYNLLIYFYFYKHPFGADWHFLNYYYYY